jgi:Spy/CpxP family protein refolding chaperone
MMRTLSTVLAVTALMALGAKLAAQEARAEVVVVERIQDLNLTPEQETRIAAIMKDHRPKNAEAIKALAAAVKDEMEKVRAVLTAQQKDKLPALKEQRQGVREESLAHRVAHLKELDLTDDEIAKIGDIRKEYGPKIVKTMQGLQALLNGEQKRIREEGLKAGKTRREVLESLRLTEAQKERIGTVANQMSTLVREEMEKIRDVLSAGQQAKLQDLKEERREHVRDRLAHRIANLRDLNLTDEQRTRLAEIRKEYRPRIQEAGNRLRASIREEVEQIVAVLKGGSRT